ncbi:MAG TPA: flavin reductase family protein [Bacillus sp. (in: firmicutes)]|uniref:flavin reductase family protein n=1 Tax=Bacillus litorisediminis TaxID=2922713 RepID=UPI001FB02F26|nr:flavin reductase family protein [Bacillus litorisediminis]HWO75193.1 flavin reductase family protein [Bacillus sp. (in: firmicutes)]
MDDRTFRNAMGKFATGITVVTTEVDGNIHGMTANAFMSVSLNPKLVLVSIGHHARMHDIIQKAGKFAVSVLAENQEEYSVIFAGQKKDEHSIHFKRLNNMPVIDGALVNLTCNVYDAHLAGDHTLYIGEVTDLTMQDGDPILYFGGKYRKLNTN